MTPLRIAIAGCGPAGMAAAMFLQRDGHRVDVFDQFDAPGPIGSGLMLQPTGLAVLRAAGLEERIEALGARINRIYGRVMPADKVVLDVTYASRNAPEAYGLAVHRAALFDVLFDAVRAQAIAVETGFPVCAVAEADAGRLFLLAADGRKRGPFDFVVDALGGRSPLSADRRKDAGAKQLPFGALWATLDAGAGGFMSDMLEQRYHRADRMVGVLPLGRMHMGGSRKLAFFWSLKPETYDAWRQAGLAAWKTEVLRLWPATEGLLGQIIDPAQFTLARYSHFTLPFPAQGRVVQIGDAAHSTSPQLGQGANMALLDAYALAFAFRGSSGVAEALKRYSDLRGLHVRLYQAISAVFTPAYQSEGALLPWLRDKVLWPISRIPPAPSILSSMVRGRLIDPLAAIGLAG